MLEAGYEYLIGFKWNNSTAIGVIDEEDEELPETGSAMVTVDENIKGPTFKKWLYGGGIRIKNIYYTDNYAPEIDEQDYPNNYFKKVSYDYNFFDDPLRSSGSLVFPKPLMEYEMTRRFDYMATSAPSGHVFAFPVIRYKVYTRANNLSFISTKGSDVGYKNVTVSETGNGKTEYEYTTPIDYPEGILFGNYPFAPTPNFDYKRGLLLEVRKYDQSNRILTKDANHYNFDNYFKTTGLTTYYFNGQDCPYAPKFHRYFDYWIGVQDPNSYVLSNGHIVGSLLNFNARGCGEYVSNFVGYILNKEAFGWSKLDTSTSTEYFYDANGNTSYVENAVSYSYNQVNMQLSGKSSTTSTGDVLETLIYYPIDPVVFSDPNIQLLINDNRIETPLLVQTKRNGNKISEVKTIYKDWGSNLLLPELVQTSKANASLETRVHYNKYDEVGNVLEVQQENGMVISYIWGYNKTQPIAKIENASNAQVTAALGLNMSTADETHLSNINNLRTTLLQAMITTYTYKPLIGVSSITDPKGYTTYYEYDSFGRLALVKDAQRNRLSENEYHYRTQN